MSTSFIQATIRRSNRNLLILCATGALLLIGFAALNARYLYNFFAGPAPIDRQALLATSDPATLRRYWVTVSGDEAIDTGFQRVRSNTNTGDERVTAAYMALLIDKHVLLVRAQDDSPVTKFTGSLVALPDDVRTRIIGDAEREEPELRGAFLPYMLDTDGFRGYGYGWLAIGVPLFGLFIFGLGRAIRRSNDPSKHPIMRGLGRFGTPAEVASQLDAELLAEHRQLGQLHLTPNWLVQASKSTLSATRIEDVVWAYKKVTQRRVNGVPAGKSYAAEIWDRHGVCVTIGGSEAVVTQVLEVACQRAPWLLAGFSPDLEKAWKSNRATMIAAVDQRRRQAATQMQGVPAQA